MSIWIDFKALRSHLDFEQVLRHFDVEVKRKGKQHHGFCPLPNHQGKRNSPSFSANLERGIFQCFGCGAKGNVLEFAALMSNVDPQDGNALRTVALDLHKRFCLGLANPAPKAKQPEKTPRPSRTSVAIINAPLDFELKGLEPEHPYLKGRGFTPKTIRHFGLGFCSRGYLKDRVAIPLHDHRGQLVGYAGRVIDDTKITEDNPRYRFPGERTRNGRTLEFRKTRFLYNGFRIESPVADLVVVESFASVWWLHQGGLVHVVATMGADCSERQEELIASLVRPDGRVWIISDGDDAGERHAHGVLSLVSPLRSVRWMKLGEGKQPTDYPVTSLRERICI